MSPAIAYSSINLRQKARAVIEQANEIIAEFLAQGFDLTLRQLFYQFVARSLIANTQREYKRLNSVITNGRLAGLIDWDAIVDRTRELRSLAHWESPQEIVQTCVQQFNSDLWADQPHYVEVWIEKDALVGVIEDVCNRYDVPHFSCRGYPSLSEVHSGALRLIRRCHDRNPDFPAVILHLGDHDPSGLDMTRDIDDRLRLFGAAVEVRRIALNLDQVQRYSLPPNSAKRTDSRAGEYVRCHGGESWELDALDPKVIVDLIEKNVAKLIDTERWDAAIERQQRARAQLRGAAENWSKIVDVVAQGEAGA